MVWNQSSQQDRTESLELVGLLLHGKRRFWMLFNKPVGLGAGLGREIVVGIVGKGTSSLGRLYRTPLSVFATLHRPRD